jgi:hypothetical protein
MLPVMSALDDIHSSPDARGRTCCHGAVVMAGKIPRKEPSVNICRHYNCKNVDTCGWLWNFECGTTRLHRNRLEDNLLFLCEISAFSSGLSGVRKCIGSIDIS